MELEDELRELLRFVIESINVAYNETDQDKQVFALTANMGNVQGTLESLLNRI